jgi:hypothetical protein
VRRGQSLALVGVSGVGKTNIVNILREDATCRRRYLGDAVDTTYFAVVNMYTWRTGQPAQLWQMMNAALEKPTSHLPPTPARVIQSIAEDERVFRRLQDRVDLVCQQHQHRVMFVLDDCDALFSTAPRAMIDQLYALRTAGNRERLTYLVITKRLPHLLGRAYNIADSKFYHLFQNHVYALGPYTPADARQMVLHLDHLAGNRLSREDLVHIAHYGGGHSGLTKAIFDAWLDAEPDRANLEAWLVQQTSVRTALQKLLDGLHAEEQAAALHLAHGEALPAEAPVLEHLRVRGLLKQTDPPRWFSHIMDLYLKWQT